MPGAAGLGAVRCASASRAALASGILRSFASSLAAFLPAERNGKPLLMAVSSSAALGYAFFSAAASAALSRWVTLAEISMSLAFAALVGGAFRPWRYTSW